MDHEYNKVLKIYEEKILEIKSTAPDKQANKVLDLLARAAMEAGKLSDKDRKWKQDLRSAIMKPVDMIRDYYRMN